jgi:hypothetical protein
VLNVYPNPALDMIHFDASTGISEISIYNALGQKQIRITNPDRAVSVKQLTSGLYIVRLTDKSGKEYKSIFIKK